MTIIDDETVCEQDVRFRFLISRTTPLFGGCRAYRFLCRPTDVEEYLANGWSAEDGLPQNTVTCITQTRDGYLWLGTWNGVVRFDGARFVVSGAHNTSEIKRNRIFALQEDRQGGLWIGPEGGGATYVFGIKNVVRGVSGPLSGTVSIRSSVGDTGRHFASGCAEKVLQYQRLC